ncbi:cytochrome P450 [Planktotalea frisia]|uniref:cytochrome P450 n=1 Tax=Planktotalea frisia TaxID=696762 RepID=UPI002356FF98|nr:cytochrome P450 [Planktotalea frisia]
MDGPSDPVNLYDDAVIRDPWPHYARLRDLGPVVWMETLGNYAFTQYDTVRNGLRDHETYISSLGAAADDFGCTHQRGNTVASDAPRHTTLRDTISPPLLRDSVETLRPQIQNIADDIVANCMQKGSFEAITDLAQPLPLMLVRDLVGLPDFGRENMLKWASAAFDMQGIQNARGQAARPVIAEMKEFITRDVTPDTLKPGSWSHRVTELAACGEIDPEIVPFAIRDYINPSLDTTISAIGHFIFHAGSNPDTWQKLKDDPSLALNAAHEAIRIGTPIRSFSRRTSKPVEIAGHQLPKRARVMMLYSSANRDETIFPQADEFDIERRNARRHLAFGAGVHMCAGMHLALLEIECLILAMTQQMPAVTVGTPTIAMNNSICAFAELPVHIQG